MSDVITTENPNEALVCVDPAKLDQIWPHVAHFIQAAYLTGIGDDTVESIKADLDAQRALLWIVWDGKGLLVAAITSIYDTPARKVCIVRACGGREMHRWIRFMVDLEAYAREKGCSVMRVHGRPGWKQYLDGYREPWVALEKELT